MQSPHIPPPNSHSSVHAVCRPPEGVTRQDVTLIPQVGGGCRVTVRSYFANGTSSNTCPAGNCNCAASNPIYGTQCGTLYASVYLYLDLAVTLSGPSLGSYLNNIGIGNVNTVYGVVYFGFGSSQPVNWSIDTWTNLEVVRIDPDGTLLSCPLSILALLLPPTLLSPCSTTARAESHRVCRRCCHAWFSVGRDSFRKLQEKGTGAVNFHNVNPHGRDQMS
jgi:hypothetical protein